MSTTEINEGFYKKYYFEKDLIDCCLHSLGIKLLEYIIERQNAHNMPVQHKGGWHRYTFIS